MKKNIILVLIIFLGNAISNAQTNTFPASGSVGVGTITPSALVDIKTTSSQYYGLSIAPSGLHHSYLVIDRKSGYDGGMLWRKDGNYVWQNVNSDNNTLQWYSYTRNGGGQQVLALDKEGYLGLGSHLPLSRLHIGGSNQEIRFDYNGTDNYYGGLRWAGLQLGNNGANRIIAGRTTQGGWLDFYVNNTNDGTDYAQAPNGLLAMRISSIGKIGVGSLTPLTALHVDGKVSGGEPASNSAIPNGILSLSSYGTGVMTTMGIEANVPQQYFWIQPRYVNQGMFYNTVLNPIAGNVGIGTTNPGSYKLAVEGTIGARKLKVTQTIWADEVFKPAYKLKPLQEVEQFILKHKHLPDIPSEKQVVGKDIDVGDTQALLLKKIEELTLYMIELKKENISQQQEINLLKKKR
jgi:hypothetical protein